jgi:hypothetical protein
LNSRFLIRVVVLVDPLCYTRLDFIKDGLKGLIILEC